MNDRLIRFVFPALLALVLSVLAGGIGFWSKGEVLIARAAAVRRAATAKVEAADRERRAQGWDFWTIEMENLVSELEGEKAQLQLRSGELDQRAARLDAERQELDRVRADIESMRHEIDGRVVTIHEDETKNLHRLAQMYATLDPTSAVAIIREMDDGEAVKILSLMKPDVTGPIFDAMARPQPDGTSLARRAAALSDKLRLLKDDPVGATP